MVGASSVGTRVRDLLLHDQQPEPASLRLRPSCSVCGRGEALSFLSASAFPAPAVWSSLVVIMQFHLLPTQEFVSNRQKPSWRQPDCPAGQFPPLSPQS